MLINQKSKRIALLSVLLLSSFFVALFIWLLPIAIKGYAAYSFSTNFTLARNLSLVQSYSMENKYNVILSPDLIKLHGQESTMGNKLTSIIYGWIFSAFGVLNMDQLVLLATIVYALAMVIFALSVYRLFGLKITLLFLLTYIFLPINWTNALNPGYFEFSLLFLSVFFLFYFMGEGKKYDFLYLAPAGLFLFLSSWSREAFFLFVPGLFLYFILTRKYRELLLVLTPFMIALSILWLPQISSNGYSNLFTTQASDALKGADFQTYGEFYPDPYTYHFDRDLFLGQNLVAPSINPIGQFYQIKNLVNFGIRRPSIYERVVIGSCLLAEHAWRFLDINQLGGPLVIAIVLLGFYDLSIKRRDLAILFLLWPVTVLLLLSYVVFAGRSHIIDMVFPLALLIALGLERLLRSFGSTTDNNKSASFNFVFIALFVCNLLLCGKNFIDNIYSHSLADQNRAYAEAVSKEDIKNEEIIATDSNGYELNYLTGKSYVVFTDGTIRKLIDQGKLDDVFDIFRVKFVLGYSDRLTAEILDNSKVKNVADSSVTADDVGKDKNKMFLLKLLSF